MNRLRDSLTSITVSAGAVFASPTAWSSDTWLETSRTATGGVTLHLMVGDCLKGGSEQRIDPGLTTRFDVVDPEKTQHPTGKGIDGTQAVLPLPGSEAQRIVVIDLAPVRSEILAKTFDDELHAQGLSTAGSDRRDPSEAGKPVLERSSRFVKLMLPGKSDELAPVSNQTFQQRLELVPMEDPSDLVPGERLHVHVLLDSAPLVGAKVELCVRATDGKVRILSSASDSLGDAAFSLPGAGTMMLLKTTHLRRLDDGQDDRPGEAANGVRSEWERLSASYGFIVPAK